MSICWVGKASRVVWTNPARVHLQPVAWAKLSSYWASWNNSGGKSQPLGLAFLSTWSDTQPWSPRSGASSDSHLLTKVSKASARTAHDTRQSRFKTNQPRLLAPDYFMQKHCLLWCLPAHPTACFSPDFDHLKTFSFSLSLFVSVSPVPEVSQRSSDVLSTPAAASRGTALPPVRHPGMQKAVGSRLETGSEPQGTSYSHSLCLRSKGQNECPLPIQKHMIWRRPYWCMHVRWEPCSCSPASCVNLDQSLNLSALTVNKIICEQFELGKEWDKVIGLA